MDQNYRRLQSLIFQIHLSLLAKPEKVLEIGIGNGFVSSYLKNYCEVTTADFDRNLNPDIILDISKKEDFQQIQKESFDLVIICEVLEHIPFSKLENVLKNLKEITKRFVLISVPNESNFISISFLKNGFKKKIYFPITFPVQVITSIINRIGLYLSDIHYKLLRRKKKFTYDGVHHWELGIDKYSVKLFREKLKKYFKIKFEKRLHENLYHHFFLLEK
ncbi:MAG: class I SAM-dependent methyltransferase [Candidatus Lokiarchaeota archaeon]|nr:class I SAM-dependent methyltransferase [Candidatus Lokiarchaeota archaeon]